MQGFRKSNDNSIDEHIMPDPLLTNKEIALGNPHVTSPTGLYNIASRMQDMPASTHESHEDQGVDRNGHIEAWNPSYVATTNKNSTKERLPCA